ncbi:uncharacterized protein TNCV_4008431 [Trichonephila clavipes]|nr:uncharacterized protein TNCV_4008431 [Trichonephila clavipes]
MSDITTLNRERSGIKSQLTKLNNVLTEGQSKMDMTELQAQLDSVLNIKQKYEALKEEYYRISKEKEFQKVEASIYEVDDDIQKLEPLKHESGKDLRYCLSDLHPLTRCNSESSCFVCKKKLDHHTLLHKYSTPTSHNSVNEVMIQAPTHFQERNQQTNNLKSIETQAPVASTSAPTRLSLFCNGNKSILINTEIVYVRDTYGEFKALRAVLGSASESSFLSSAAAHILGLKIERVNIPICGLNESSLNVKKKVTTVLSDENNDSFWEIDLLIVPNIANLTPSKRLNISNLNIPRQVKLADPSFHIPQKIDVLLGAELFFSFLNNDKIKIAENLFLQSSVFGYLVSGVVSDNNFYNTPKNCFLTKNLDILDKTLKRFWEIEDVETTEVYSDDLKYCNDHFEKTHLRKPDGKFIVEMPFKPDSSEGILGNSKAIA